MIRHHPFDAILIAQATGRLPALHAAVPAVHLSACPHCRGELRRMEEIGGALLAELPPEALRPDALARTLSPLHEEVVATPAAATTGTLGALAVGRWWWLGPGIRLTPLSRRAASGTRLDLIGVAPGVAMPGPGHTGPEMASVLQGAYADEAGGYSAYDVAEGDVALHHTPAALPGIDCICRIATTGRLRGHTWVAPLVQPLIGV
jgi:putative transcriptional regulator